MAKNKLKLIDMKTTINTKTANEIIITSVFKNDKLWSNSEKMQNYNNHKITVKCNGKKYTFDFWGSINSPEIKTENENIFAFYCSLSDAISAKDSFENFCSELGYDTDSRKAEKIYKACLNTLSKVEKVFDCDLYDLINELQETYEL